MKSYKLNALSQWEASSSLWALNQNMRPNIEMISLL